MKIKVVTFLHGSRFFSLVFTAHICFVALMRLMNIWDHVVWVTAGFLSVYVCVSVVCKRALLWLLMHTSSEEQAEVKRLGGAFVVCVQSVGARQRGETKTLKLEKKRKKARNMCTTPNEK